MKKVTAIIVSILSASIMTACSSSNTSSEVKQDEKAEETTIETTTAETETPTNTTTAAPETTTVTTTTTEITTTEPETTTTTKATLPPINPNNDMSGGGNVEHKHAEYNHYKHLISSDDTAIYVFGKVKEYELNSDDKYIHIVTDDGEWMGNLSLWDSGETRSALDVELNFPVGSKDIYLFGRFDGQYNNMPSVLVRMIKYQDKYYNSDSFYHHENRMTSEQSNAVNKAKSYLKYSAFSRQGLIEQLEFEGYSHDDSVYAADNCGADWFEQAAKKAQQYLDYSSFSRDGLIEQLEYEGFTHDQAEYGVSAVGY